MLLVFDIGNSRTKLGLYEQHMLKSVVSFDSHAPKYSEECKEALRLALLQVNESANVVTGIAITSVVPKLTEKTEELCASLFSRSPLIISPRLQTGLQLLYETPEKLGSDRLCNAVAGYAFARQAVIIVDWGTATKFDVVSPEGTYLGGAIAPGLAVSALSLTERTAQLPEAPLEVPPHVIGRNTTECLQSGIMYGCIEMTRGMLSRLKRGTDTKYKIIATGGFAPLLARYVRGIDSVERYLVLEGARLIYERQQS